MDYINKDKINWFPGHMKKATEEIKAKIKIIDIIIEIIDSRSIKNSSNDELIKEVSNNKKVIKIALKKDLSEKWNNDEILIGSIKDSEFRKKILTKINKEAKPIIDKMLKKGIVNPKIYLMVVGLPNVGKSSFINFVAKKSQLIASDKPGVTKKMTWIKVNQNIEMMDTPGILFKKIEDIKVGYILTLLRCVKWEIVPKYDVIHFAYKFYIENYKKDFMTFFKIENEIDFQKFLEIYCKNKGFVISKNEWDFEKALEKLYKDFSLGRICNINYEK